MRRTARRACRAANRAARSARRRAAPARARRTRRSRRSCRGSEVQAWRQVTGNSACVNAVARVECAALQFYQSGKLPSVWRSVGQPRNPMSFATLGLDASLLSTLAALGYAAPTPVQRAAIPAVLAGGDLLVSSQTGSGKTAAFLLPGMQRLLSTPGRGAGKGPRFLVLAPTRELAM